MQVIKTFEEAQFDSTATIAHIGINRKDSIDAFHAGHELCISEGKKVADIVMLTFWEPFETLEYLYGDETDEFTLNPNDVLSHDETACIQWALSQGVDIVYYPEKGEMIKIFDDYIVSDLKSWVNGISSTEGYSLINTNSLFIFKATLIYEKARNEKAYRKDYKVTSWKDGYTRYLERHFLDNYVNCPTILVPTLKDSESNLPYSNRAYDLMNDQERQWISQVEDIVIDNSSILHIDIEHFKQDVTDQINMLDSTGVFYVTNIEVYNDSKFMDSDILVEVDLHVNDKFRSEGIVGRFPYVIRL